MAESTDLDEREKFDHSGHPTHRAQPGDLHAPEGGSADPDATRHSRSGVRQKEPVTPPDSRVDANGASDT